MMVVEIDSHSGFCAGVIRAIAKAEEILDGRMPDGTACSRLFSLGDIVHNEAELARLSAKGLVTIDRDDMEQIDSAPGENLLIRAHGEPPETYRLASKLGFNVIDCTCPVVLKIQKSIREASGQILIFGKIGHAEVLGLMGQAGGRAVVVETRVQLVDALSEGKVRLDRPLEVFSQTTMSPVAYAEVCSLLEEKVADRQLLKIHDTICRQVASRHMELASFASGHDVIVFVAGRASSNGKVLCELCRSVNIRTYHVDSIQDIHPEWFRPDDKVGVCGATSTPKWLLEKVAAHIENLH